MGSVPALTLVQRVPEFDIKCTSFKRPRARQSWENKQKIWGKAESRECYKSQGSERGQVRKGKKTRIGTDLGGCSFSAYNWKLPACSGAFLFTVVFGSFFTYNFSFLLTALSCLLAILASLLTAGKCV